jgi:hypothetical protein
MAVVLGWLVVLADQPIYILFEGRRWWRSAWCTGGTGSLAKRLHASRTKADNLYAQNDPSNIEEYIRTLDFPLDKSGEPFVQYPTRLGNIVEAYETYPMSAYGIDAIFYWPRLWLMLDKDLRASLDESQAIADGALYVSFCLLLCVPVVCAYAAGGWLSLFPGLRLFDLPCLPSPIWTTVGVPLLLVAARLTYELGLWQQRAYGELFKAMFDQFQDKLGFAENVAAVVVSLGGERQRVLDNKYKETALYLRWHRIRPPGEPDTLTPEKWAQKKPKG